MSKKEFLRLISIISSMEVEKPLYRKDFFEIAKFAEDCGLVVNLTTNGFLVNEISKNYSKLSMFSQINISLDSISREGYTKIREYDGFENAMKLQNVLIFPPISLDYERRGRTKN
ncbi:hypothetical protein Asulf_00379 [Archaeoglobus sulfaticallidus PM70-1]|uniref:Radical SAM core domain-containing protein n=2 Tax=Archaeoglobus TaxID=2233 RepID=N0BBM2_9EURY|nr:hypothetical protein Asulf_00379 [Archaeoglobus sulfaticallidus PM70-1]